MTGEFQYVPAPGAVTPALQLGDDPDAELSGVDLAWLTGDPGPGGTCPRRTGIACVRYDLPNRAMLVPGDLVQFPAAGAALGKTVNAALSDAELVARGATLEEEFRRDDRVEAATVDTSASSDGLVSFVGQVRTRAGQDLVIGGGR